MLGNSRTKKPPQNPHPPSPPQTELRRRTAIVRPAPAEVEQEDFRRRLPGVLQRQKITSRVLSLGDGREGPTSYHWSDATGPKLLIRRVGRVQKDTSVEPLLTQIAQFKERGNPTPTEIYIDIGQAKTDERALGEFTNRLIDGINHQNGTSHTVLSEENVDSYLKITVGPRPDQTVVLSRRKPAVRSLSDSESEEDKEAIPLLRGKPPSRVLVPDSDEEAEEDLSPPPSRTPSREARASASDQDEDDDTRFLFRRAVDRSPEESDEEQGSTTITAADAASVSRLTRKVNADAGELQDTASGLSESNQKLLTALRGQLHLLEEAEQAIAKLAQQRAELERQIEASFPPAIPLRTLIGFQPAFQALQAQDQTEVVRLSRQYRLAGSEEPLRNSFTAREKIEEILRSGLIPGGRVQGGVLSGDDRVANVVSVNVLPFNSSTPAGRAEFATVNRAGGAIPIAIEQRGDRVGRLDARVLAQLTQRAIDSAVFIIDASRLAEEQQRQVQSSQENGGGELGLSDVPPHAIVGLLLPATMQHLISDDLRNRYAVQFVGARESSVFYAGTGQNVEILHPDYEPAFRALLGANPETTLLTHTTRLGGPNPIR